MKKISAIGAACAVMAASAAFAQGRGPGADAAADRITAAENLKYVELSKAVDARNAEKKKAYEAAVAAYEAAVKARDLDIAAADAAQKAALAEYEAAKAEWAAAVKACKAGDRTKCKS